MESLEIIELNHEQQKTIKQAFKVDYLKDEIELAKLFDYDFNFDEDLNN